MKMKRWMTLGLVSICVATHAGYAQTPDASAPTYVNENGTDPAPLNLRDVSGIVRGLGGDAMPRASVSLFSEEGHALLTTVMSDKGGKFKFEKVDHGLYRVVVKVAGLCPANVPIKVESSLLAHRRLVITMRPKDIDTCSYGMTK